MKGLSLLVLLIFTFILTSCDRPECKNTNPIFDANSFESNIYKKELIKEIDEIGKENLTYWLSDYSEQNGQEYVVIYIQGQELCAKGLIHVTDWKNMKGIRSTKGKGYRGAQLKDFDFEVTTEVESIAFEFKSLSSIID
ncbi:MAG: hypothetical protein AAFX87_02020 [Bacteroidota bacterium]